MCQNFYVCLSPFPDFVLLRRLTLKKWLSAAASKNEKLFTIYKEFPENRVL